MTASSSICIEQFTTITLQVSDLDRSLHFYRDGLGIEFNQPTSAEAAGAQVGDVLLLLHKDFEPGLATKERGAGVELHFGVSDADVYSAELQGRGITPATKPEDRPWGRVFSLTDPDGYAIEFVAPHANR